MRKLRLDRAAVRGSLESDGELPCDPSTGKRRRLRLMVRGPSETRSKHSSKRSRSAIPTDSDPNKVAIPSNCR